MTPTPPSLIKEQKNQLVQHLSMVSHDRADVGQGLPRTTWALVLGQGNNGGAARLETLADALVFERMIVPIDVESDPCVAGVHAGENGHNPTSFVRAQAPAGEALAIYFLAQALSAHRLSGRPMALGFRTIGLTTLVEAGKRTVANPDIDTVPLPRPVVVVLVQEDEWLPAWRDEALCELLLAKAIVAYPAIVDAEATYTGDDFTRVVTFVDRVPFIQGTGALVIKETLSAALNAPRTGPRLTTSADRVKIALILR